jgi:hypothetical protein
MKTNGIFVRGITALLMIGVFLLSFSTHVPTSYAAEEETGPFDSDGSDPPAEEMDEVVVTADDPGDPKPPAAKPPGEKPKANPAACLVSSLLAQILTNSIYAVIAAAVTTLGIPGVRVKIENSTDEIKTYGVTIAGTYFPIIPGLDSIAYCLLNSIIEYIANATIQWINSGFEGNPAFVDDPQQFFQSVVDYEIANFMKELQEGLICQPLQVDLQLAMLQQATQNYAQQARCGQGGANAINTLGTGRYSTANSNRVLLNPNTNPVTNYFNATDSLTARVQGKRGLIEMEVNWGRGFLSVQDPENPNRRITLGTLIESAAAKRIGFAEDRLLLAEKFDQVITALVNQLVKIAINELFSESGVQVNVQEVNYEAYKQYLQRYPDLNQRPFLEGSTVPAR